MAGPRLSASCESAHGILEGMHGVDPPPALWLRAPHLRAAHGFSTRHGGVSQGVYAGLNLDDREDDPARVQENRRRAVQALGFSPEAVSRLNQVHGLEVVRARPGVQTADAQVSDDPSLLLVIGTADCLPVLLEDPQAGVVGAAHAGWRGALGRLAARTVAAMTELGARPERLRVAIGPGVCAAHYPVGPEVASAFREAGLGEALRPPEPGEAREHLDLVAAVRQSLDEAGVPSDQLWDSGRCSFEADFYSFRRDGGKTGRMWAATSAKMNGS